MSTPISVIIPIYNHEKYVEKAINSVIHQTHPDLEIILIDDGSLDGSADRVERLLKTFTPLKDKNRTFVFLKEKNKGAYASINQGISLSSHPLITILNSDDFYAPDRLELMACAMEKAEAQLAFSEIIAVDGNDHHLSPLHQWVKSYEEQIGRVTQLPTASFGFLFSNYAITTGNFLFHRNLINKVGLFKDYFYAHDYDFILRVIEECEPLFVRQPLYFYRIHGANTINISEQACKNEVSEILSNFRLKMMTKAPKNPLAPSPVNFPLEFEQARIDSRLDAHFSKYLKSYKALDKELKEQPHQSCNLKGERVALITHQLTYTGAPKVVFDMALQLKKEGKRPHVYSLQKGPLVKQLSQQGIPVSIIPKLFQTHQHKSFIAKALAIGLMYIYLFLKMPKKVIVNSFASLDAGFPIGWIPFRERLWFIHESFAPATVIPKALSGKAFKLLQSNAFKMLFGSNATKTIWDRAGIHGETLYWSGIPKKSSNTQKSRPIRKLLAIGSIEVRKGIHTLVEAFIDCVKNRKIPEDVTLTILGFPEEIATAYQGEIVRKVIIAGLENRIFLTKSVPQDQIDRFYDEADLFVMSSSNECLPLVLLTAMSKGLPIISSDAFGCKEAIIDGLSGYSFAMQRTQMLSDKIVEAIHNPEEAFLRGQRAFERFNELFCLERSLEKWRNLMIMGNEASCNK